MVHMSQLKIVLVKKAKEQEVRYRHRLDIRSSASIPVQRTNELAIAQQSSNREIRHVGKKVDGEFNFNPRRT